MKIARIDNTNVSSKAKWDKKSNISIDLIKRVNQRMIETGGKSKKLTPLDKIADIMLDENSKKIPTELNRVKSEFDALSKDEQDRLLLFAKCRKNVRELINDKERLNSAFKKAWDSVVGKNNKKS